MTELDASTGVLSELLWLDHADELLRFATVLVGPADAHDIVVDTIIRTASTVAGEDVINRRAYLYRAVTNHAHDLRRARERRWRRDLAAVGPADIAAPDSYVDVRRAISRLSLSQRAVIFLAYWEDATEREIASTLNVSPGTVRRHLTRARAHLRKALQ